ncbi:glycoside hydrolase family 140 protein [Xanthocytophaga agilis]|uniref:Glycoside hydrolase family 140 protein n=1 Tax=Xanthocytophaga agilis TaxID=3048010 RepID=A0AAE3UIT4_9BACT|nr:glycoside hydrolase family 140 protein [Xanthocytophaga agilis]MDJ1504108.1 glycoside hydrolase family 140 protein [Xanthocytophaga agilis]
MSFLENSQRLKVNTTKRFLTYDNGEPFFYLGDTAWELFHRLTRNEADLYLQDRASKGFTVIQAVALAELDGLTVSNPYGEFPLIDKDPTKVNEKYFEHVDYIIQKAASLGLFTGLLPTWGDKWNKKWGAGPEIFTVENARLYGIWIANRYKNYPIIWILGGDRPIETENHKEVICAMAEGIRSVTGNTQLMTFHPMGDHTSSEVFHNDLWLDFNMFQSGHVTRNLPNYKFTLNDYHKTPTKPVLDGEPRYEDHPVNWRIENGYFDDFDIRQAAYWSMLSGACGHTYGNHNIWQFWQIDRKPISAARTSWNEALKHPGASQLGYMRQLFESRPWQLLLPDQTIVGLIDSQIGHVKAALASDGSFAFVYVPNGESITMNMTRLSSQQLVAWWYNPKTGIATSIGKVFGQNFRMFKAPGELFRSNDWVLVIDDYTRGFGVPGIKL